MKLQDLKKYTDAELEALQFEMVKRGNLVAANSIANFKEFYGKTVRVVKGCKVPKGELRAYAFGWVRQTTANTEIRGGFIYVIG